MKIILDASVIAKPYLDQDVRGAMVIEVLFDERFEIYEPHLWRFEVMNAVKYSLDQKKAKPVLQNLAALNLQEITINNWLELAKLAYDNDVTMYDACYHYLAVQENGLCVTADFKYYKKLKNTSNIIMLDDFLKTYY